MSGFTLTVETARSDRSWEGVTPLMTKPLPTLTFASAKGLVAAIVEEQETRLFHDRGVLDGSLRIETTHESALKYAVKMEFDCRANSRGAVAHLIYLITAVAAPEE